MLHTDLAVRMSMGEVVEVEIPSTVGEKQGDTLVAMLSSSWYRRRWRRSSPVFEAAGIEKLASSRLNLMV
jgi:hypothetical protein